MAQAAIVGLDIGSQLMKAVEITASPKHGLAVTAIAVSPTPAGVLQNGMLTDPQLMAQAVKQMFKDAGIRAKRVVGSIAGQSSVVVRIIEVPRMTPAELAETMKWEVERHVPFSPTEVEMDFQPLPIVSEAEANSPNMSVLLAVAQKDMVNYYVEMLFKAGLDPIAIDIEPLASGRALIDIENGVPVQHVVYPVVAADGTVVINQDVDNPQTLPSTVAVVNIGANNTDISIFEGGTLIFPRSLALAGDTLTNAISEALGYQVDQAERLKIEHGQVLMDRLGDYANQSYVAEAVEFPYGQPEEDPSSIRPVGLPDSGPLGRNPFDSGPLKPRSPFESAPLQQKSPFESGPIGGTPSDRINSGPLGASTSFDTQEAGTNTGEPTLDLERTQPIQRRALDLAQRATAPGFEGEGSEGGPAPDSVAVQVFDAILPVLIELATELRRSLDYYRSRAGGHNVDKVVLCGGTASLVGLDRYLEQELQVPVVVADPLAGLNVTTKHFDVDYLRSIAPLFAVSLGLATRLAVMNASPAPVAAKPEGGSKGGFQMPAFLLGKKSKKGDTTASGNTTLPPGS